MVDGEMNNEMNDEMNDEIHNVKIVRDFLTKRIDTIRYFWFYIFVVMC